MSLIWPTTESWTALRRAVAPALSLEALPHQAGRPIEVAEGAEDGPLRELQPGVIRLHPGLLGPELYHPQDARWLQEVGPEVQALALDRFRRTIGLLLEGFVLHGLAEELGQPIEELAARWEAVAWAAQVVDLAQPALGWLWPEAVDLLRSPEASLLAHPRRGAWLLHWRTELGRPAYPSAPLDLDEAEWLAFGGWCRDPVRGLGARAPLPLPGAKVVEPSPWEAQPLAHREVQTRAGPAGLRIKGPMGTREIPDGATLRFLQGSIQGGTQQLHLEPIGPLGDWVVEVGSGGGRVFAAQGLEVSLRANGELELTMANAFAGPVSGDMLELAKKFGASGTGTGRWRVGEVGPSGGAIVLSDLDIDGVTVHPRMSTRFALPAKGWMEPVRRTLELLSGTPLRFQVAGDKLVLTGKVAGFDVKLELKRVQPLVI